MVVSEQTRQTSKALKIVDDFRRTVLKDLLLKCTEKEQNLFWQMYGYPNKHKDVWQISIEYIDWAIMQCESTLIKKGKK